MGSAAPAYSFGTTPTAADRLLVLARVFDGSMAAALSLLPRRRFRALLDLGCGPGSTTERLLAHVDAERAVGVDASAEFLALARERFPAAEFVAGDVREKFPLERPDLVYARYLLSHLSDPLDVVRGWASQLAPDGFLVLEEPEGIHSSDPLVEEYLRLTEGLIAGRGADLYVGKKLRDLGGVANRCLEVPVPMRDAATMFSMNIATIRNDGWVKARYDEGTLDRLAVGLERRATGEVGLGEAVVWSQRQVVIAGGAP
ncbi:methyltransferase type 11 [Hyaloraphidium curvatum]|nr:methyltransferase type 11 [Hyaloraphidium curvatum]